MTFNRISSRSAMQFEVLEGIPEDWDCTVAASLGGEVFHSSPWLRFLQTARRVRPTIVRVQKGNLTLGHIVGGVVSAYGLRLFGSPLPGWGTQCQGLILSEDVDRIPILESFPRFAVGHMRVFHVEMIDRSLSPERTPTGWNASTHLSYQVDLTQSRPKLFAGLGSTTRNYVRRAERDDLAIEMNADPHRFRDVYFEQLAEVFGLQGLRPPYPPERIETLTSNLELGRDLLIVGVGRREGAPLSSLISIGQKHSPAILWGAASTRALGGAHPNEVMHWTSMCYWQEQGSTVYNFSGSNDYKSKYGGELTPLVRLTYSLVPFSSSLRATGLKFRNVLRSI